MKIVDLSVTMVSDLPVDPPAQIPRIEYHSHTEEQMLASFMRMFPGLKKEDIAAEHPFRYPHGRPLALCQHHRRRQALLGH